jgi:hypothetical protein
MVCACVGIIDMAVSSLDFYTRYYWLHTLFITDLKSAHQINNSEAKTTITERAPMPQSKNDNVARHFTILYTSPCPR